MLQIINLAIPPTPPAAATTTTTTVQPPHQATFDCFADGKVFLTGIWRRSMVSVTRKSINKIFNYLGLGGVGKKIRGAWGLETFLLLLAWKVFLPHRVCLLRGNHETKYCTSVYGFKKEVLTKYGDEGMYAYQKCLNCFKELPLASIIAGKVYTAHGGLFRSIPVTHSKRSKGKKKRNISSSSEASPLSIGTLEQLFKARRSVLDPPGEGSNLIPSDVLWSDPSSNKKSGLSLNEDRCISLLWGPDCTENFLKNSNLKLIIRSHEGPDARDKRPDMEGMDNGFTIDHCVASGKLITLFSAPDYPQFQATEDRYKQQRGICCVKIP